MIATASCRALHRFELHHQARLQRSNPHRACRISPAHHARFPPLEAFGRRPPECAAPSIMRPASETLHTSGGRSRASSASGLPARADNGDGSGALRPRGHKETSGSMSPLPAYPSTPGTISMLSGPLARILSGRRVWYSGDSYQVRAATSVGNSMIRRRVGSHPLSSLTPARRCRWCARLGACRLGSACRTPSAYRAL